MSCFNLTLGDSIAECCPDSTRFIRLRDGVVLFNGPRQYPCPMGLESAVTIVGTVAEKWTVSSGEGVASVGASVLGICVFVIVAVVVLSCKLGRRD